MVTPHHVDRLQEEAHVCKPAQVTDCIQEMVNIEIPKDYAASPSSFSGTPHLTINREVAADLDSANAFEGMNFAT